MDLYQLIRDLIDEAKKQKNETLIQKLIDIELIVLDIQKENKELKEKLEQKDNIERHIDGNYITLKNEEPKIKYCSTCWGNGEKLIQINENHKSGVPQCPVCYLNWLNVHKK